MHPFRCGKSPHLLKFKGKKVLISSLIAASRDFAETRLGTDPRGFGASKDFRLIAEADVQATAARENYVSIHMYFNLEKLRKSVNYHTPQKHTSS